MSRNTLYILWFGLMISLTSLFYFLSLVFHVPVIVTAIVVLVTGILSNRYLVKNIPAPTDTDKSTLPLFILSGGILLITAVSAILVRKHGDTDAISNWNFAAGYLADPVHWQNLFMHSGIDAHPDYPLGYSGAIAFFWRLTGHHEEIISLAITYIPTLCIPVLIFLELYKKHLPIASVFFLLFAFNSYYINCGLNQYADTLLSFYLLGAIIAMRHYEKSTQPIYLLLCTAMLGCCLWIKNEGIIICGLFAIFYFRTFLSRQNIKIAALGIFPFVLCYLFFKLKYAPANDIAALSDKNPMAFLADKSRYKLITTHLSESFNGNFHLLKMILIAYTGYCLVARRNPARPVYLLFSVFCIYMLIYLITPRDLEWHLRTSLDRLILQLYPSVLFVAGVEITRIKILSSDNQPLN